MKLDKLSDFWFELTIAVGSVISWWSKLFLTRFLQNHWYWLIPLPVFLFSISSFLIVYAEFKPSLSISRDGLYFFVDLFDLPIKSLGGCIVITTITVAIYRAAKIDQQLKLAQISTFRNNYFDLAKLYEFKYAKIDLLKNYFHIFPDVSKGSTNINSNIEYALVSIIDIILSVKKGNSEDNWSLGQLTGLSLVGILYYENDLKENLIIRCPPFKSFELDNIQDDLLKRASDYLTLSEFVSNFDSLFTPDTINDLREALMDLRETNSNNYIMASKLRSDCDRTMSDSRDEFIKYKLSNPAIDMFSMYIITDQCQKNNYDIDTLKGKSDYVKQLALSVDDELLNLMTDEISKLYFSRNFDGLPRKLLNTRRFKKLINLR